MERNTILIVDDVEVNRLLLQEMFTGIYKVSHAQNGREAIEVLKRDYSHIAAILLDLEMPVMNGFEFLEATSTMTEAEKIPIIVVTVDDTNTSQLRVLDYGVADLIRKPYDARIVLKRVKNAITLFEYQERLEEFLEQQTVRLEEKENELARVNEGLIDALSSIVEFRDYETGEHVQRIKDYTRILCETMVSKYPDCGISQNDIKYIVSASAMHDIGKIAISDTILLKPGKLDTEEFETIKTHTCKGAEILDKVEILNSEAYMKYCRNICMYHHEKYDGKGYPLGLKGEEIPIEAQIVSIADVFDALVSKRCYKDAYSVETTRQMILDGECGQFSDRIIDCFITCFDLFKEVALGNN